MISLLVVACLVLGWIPPLVVGIVRLRRRSASDTVGVVLTAVGSVWGVGGLMLGLCGGMFWILFNFVGAFDQVEQFDPSQYEGPMGTIVVSYEGQASLQVLSTAEDEKILELSADDGRFQAPVGDYRLWMFTAIRTGEGDSMWYVSAFLESGDSDNVSVQADSETPIDLGPPFAASIAVTEDKVAGKVNLELQYADSDGHQYTMSRFDWDEATSPGFEVRSSTGELVLKGQFEYG